VLLRANGAPSSCVTHWPNAFPTEAAPGQHLRISALGVFEIAEADVKESKSLKDFS